MAAANNHSENTVGLLKSEQLNNSFFLKMEWLMNLHKSFNLK